MEHWDEREAREYITAEASAAVDVPAEKREKAIDYGFDNMRDTLREYRVYAGLSDDYASAYSEYLEAFYRSEVERLIAGRAPDLFVSYSL